MSPYSARERPAETVRPDASNRLYDSIFDRYRYCSGTPSVRLQIAPGRRGDAGVRCGSTVLTSRGATATNSPTHA
jgi:hypothetical protein